MKTVTFLIEVTLPFVKYTEKTTVAEFVKGEMGNIREGILSCNHAAKIDIKEKGVVPKSN